VVGGYRAMSIALFFRRVITGNLNQVSVLKVVRFLRRRVFTLVTWWPVGGGYWNICIMFPVPVVILHHTMKLKGVNQP
jgi:hypothetical protein